MDDQPDATVRRKLLRDMLGFGVGGAVSIATRPFPVLPGGGEGEARPEDQAQADPWPLHQLQERFAEKTGLSYRQIDESHLDDLLSDLRTALERGEATIRIPREKFVGFFATYARAKIFQEKRVYLADLQFSKEESGTTLDIVAHASFGRLWVQVRKSPVSESEVSDFSSLCEGSRVEEGWLVAPGLDTKIIRGEPVRLWENRYVVPVVRLMDYDTIFDWLLSPVVPSLEREVLIEDQAVVLRLSLGKAGEDRSSHPGSLPEMREKGEAL
jgi:hypothetical protein